MIFRGVRDLDALLRIKTLLLKGFAFSGQNSTIAWIHGRPLPQGMRYAYFIDMFWLIGLLAVSSGSLLIVINGLRKAPEAFEGEHGLHILRRSLRGAGILRNRRPSGEEARSSLQSPVSHSP